MIKSYSTLQYLSYVVPFEANSSLLNKYDFFLTVYFLK